MLDEAAFVGACASLDAEPGLERCEWAVLAQPCLNDDHGNGCQVRQPEPQVVDPAPAQPVACQNHDKAAHYEEHDSEVDDEHCISQKLEGHDGGWWRRLTFELRGRSRNGAWPARRSIDLQRLAGQVPCRWRSRSSEGLGVGAEVTTGAQNIEGDSKRDYEYAAKAPKVALDGGRLDVALVLDEWLRH
jgi:hypothetical protein